MNYVIRKNCRRALALVPLVVSGGPSLAHQAQSHQNLSRAGLAYLVQNDPDFSCAGGLETVLLVGAVAEDDNPRWLFHFDPALWVSNSSCTAAQWGLARNRCTVVNAAHGYTLVNEHTWSDAVDHAFDPASGLPSDAGWMDLGYVLHLLEDMSSPAHVRNDAHPINDPFEAHSNGQAVSSFSGTIVSYGSPTDYFIALRDYTQRHHYSDDTVFAPGFPGPVSASQDVNYFYDASGRRIARKNGRYYASCPLFPLTEAGCNPRAAGIDRTIALEQWGDLNPLGVQYVASLIRRYFDDAAPLVSLVRNGSFESGNLSGWSRSDSYGCDFPYYAGPNGPYEAVVGGNATNGSKSARVGKWTQVYSGGIHGPALPGEEPCGYNIVYQDIAIPADVTSAELKFDYNIQEYDTAAWSWFDMRLLSPSSGSVLLNVVSQAGKPGLDYGTYWNGGWQSTTVDISAWKGQSLRLWFGVRQDGWGDQIATWVDSVKVSCSH